VGIVSERTYFVSSQCYVKPQLIQSNDVICSTSCHACLVSVIVICRRCSFTSLLSLGYFHRSAHRIINAVSHTFKS